MLIDAEKQELESLRNKNTLTESEKERLAELEAKEESLDDEDKFDDAFNEAMNGDKGVTKDEGEEDKQTTDQSDKDESDQDDDDDIFNGTPEDNGSESDSGEEDGEEELSPEQAVANLEAELAKEKQRTSSWEGRISAANKRAEEAEAKLKEQTKQDKGKDLPVGDSDEDVVLSEFIEEFPSLEKPIKLLATKIAREIVEREIGEIKPTITQVQETVKSREEQTHISKIRQAHLDYKDIYQSGALTTWIGHQPKFLQPGLQRVVEEGSAEEIVELFDTYKRSTGRSKKIVNNNGDKATKKRAKSLEAVTHSSSGPPKDKKVAEKDDFDGAWAEAVSR